MEQWMYVEEKLHEIRSSHRYPPESVPGEKGFRRPLGSLARRAGHALKRAGDALESWSAPLPADRTVADSRRA